jgi:hypothetical protein
MGGKCSMHGINGVCGGRIHKKCLSENFMEEAGWWHLSIRVRITLK